MAVAAQHERRPVCDESVDARRPHSPGSADLARVAVMPCALVHIDPHAKGSPNCTDDDPMCYVEQAVTLNRSLLAAGMPALTIGTNARPQVERHLASFEESARPKLLDLNPSMALPKTTRFYAAHFKLDLLEQVGHLLPERALCLMLDTDMVALRPLDQHVLQRCYRNGAGAFDISDQEFFAYGATRVIGDLEVVAGKPLNNPRWFGGECLLASASFIRKLLPSARECFDRYALAIDRVNHCGDEAFVSAALNLLADGGEQIIDVGPYQLVGRHWSGNTHRDLRWFRHCSLLHLPGCKKMLARQARRRVFGAARIWRYLLVAHMIGQLTLPVKRKLRSRLGASRQRDEALRPQTGKCPQPADAYGEQPRHDPRIAPRL